MPPAAMFRWTCPQPLVSQLDKHLQEAGALQRPWGEREPGDALIFQPLHLLLEDGRLPWAGIKEGLRMLLLAAGETPTTVVNAEQLLGCPAEQLAQWEVGQGLPGGGSGEDPPAVAGCVAMGLLQLDDELRDLHQQLDAHCRSGDHDNRHNYLKRLQAIAPEDVISQFNQQQANVSSRASLETLQHQLFEVEDECERQYLLGLDMLKRLNSSRRLNRHLIEQLQRYAHIASRILTGLPPNS